jgi:hypothetical protein
MARSAVKKPRRYVCNFVPGIGQVHGTGFTEPELMTLANMRSGAQAHSGHARSHGRLDAARAVFDDKA